MIINSKLYKTIGLQENIDVENSAQNDALVTNSMPT